MVPVSWISPPSQHHDAIGDLGDDREVVRNIDAGYAARPHDRLECLQHLDLRRHVECRRRLVEDHQLGIADQRHGRRQPLQLPARNLVRITLRRSFPGRAATRPGTARPRAARACSGRHQLVDARDLDDLVHDRWGGVEGGGGTLRNVGDVGAAQPGACLFGKRRPCPCR